MMRIQGLLILPICLLAVPGHAGILSPPRGVTIRLFEILEPDCIEITARAPALPHAVSPRRPQPPRTVTPAPDNSGRDHDSLVVCIDDDTLWYGRRPVLVSRFDSILVIRSADVEYRLGPADTVTISSPQNCVWVSATSENGKQRLEPRAYSGSLHVFIIGGEMCVTNSTTLIDYLCGVLAAETPSAPGAALQAQAVVARTYALTNWERHQQSGYQFCDLTHCQVYKGIQGVSGKIKAAVVKTRGEILTFHHQPIEAFYSSTCGGVTADDEGMWGSRLNREYLVSIVDTLYQSTLCAASPHFRWQYHLPRVQLHNLLQRELGVRAHSVSVTRKSASGRVRELAIVGNEVHFISGEDFRALVCRARGWNTLKSTAFELKRQNDQYTFAGRGLGHGLGLCQYGAIAMARQGFSYREILQHYFPGTRVQNSRN